MATLNRDLSQYMLSNADWTAIEEIAGLIEVGFLQCAINLILIV